MNNLFKLAAIAVAFPLSVCGQGSFQNLDFEAGTLLPESLQNPALALPAWTCNTSYVGYNTMVAGTVSILGSGGFGATAIEGNYSLFFQDLYPNLQPYPDGHTRQVDPSISQTGLVPVDALSLLFKAQPGQETLLLSLNGQNIPFFAVGTGPNYTLFGGDVSAFAGQTSDLTFAVAPDPSNSQGWNIDSIVFSNQSVPEPSTFALLASAVGLFLSLRRHRVRI